MTGVWIQRGYPTAIGSKYYLQAGEYSTKYLADTDAFRVPAGKKAQVSHGGIVTWHSAGALVKISDSSGYYWVRIYNA